MTSNIGEVIIGLVEGLGLFFRRRPIFCLEGGFGGCFCWFFLGGGGLAAGFEGDLLGNTLFFSILGSMGGWGWDDKGKGGCGGSLVCGADTVGYIIYLGGGLWGGGGRGRKERVK